MALYSYLNFGTNCREAFTAYHEIFGGELTIMGAGDMPSDEPIPAEMADVVIHAALRFDDGQLLMASDTGAADFGPVQGMYVNFNHTDVAEVQRVFDALAVDAEIEMPMEAVFWSPAFGVLVDRFGTPWMISAEGEAPQG